jgi:hypothetical protein
MPYTAWKYMAQTSSSTGMNSFFFQFVVIHIYFFLNIACFLVENMSAETVERVSLLAIAWERKVQVAKLVKSELKVYGKWSLDSAAIGLAWLDDQVFNHLFVPGLTKRLATYLFSVHPLLLFFLYLFAS